MLLVEDNPVDVDLLQERISLLDGLVVDMDRAESLADGLNQLATNNYDIMLLDLGLPDSTGLDTLRKAIEVSTEIPIIVLTGLDDEETAVEALGIGAQDYLPKSRLNPEMLRRAIRYSVERKKIEREFVEVYESAQLAERKHSEELREIIDIAAHELRHPATVFKGYANTLLLHGKNLDEETLKEALESIDQAADRLARMVSQLFDTSRIERGLVELRLEETEPLTLMRRAAYETASRHPELQVEIESTPDVHEVRLDGEKVKDILAIMLDNTAVHCPDSGPVDLSCRMEGDSIMFSVADRGPGVPVEVSGRIFDRFFQVDGAEHHSKTGVGLGLYIAMRYVNWHGGWIRVDDREGGGSVFSFGIPID